MAGKGNPMQGYQEATNQLLAINEQRKSNNAQAKMEETLQAAQNNTLAQASEFVATQSPQATVQPANLNPATQNILGQYGLGQPKIQKTSSSSQQVTKQNITINNKNTTITNNNVSVPANSGGPIQGRPIQFQDPGQIKFKTWLSNSFAQQNEQAAKRQREYEKRDAALVRNSNKLMKRLEETGKSIATGLNPKNMASSMGNQFKTLLMVFGFARLAKEWPNLMTWVDGISKKVSNIASDIKGFFSPDGGLAHMLGGKKGEGPLTALKNLFIAEDGILPYIGQWLKNKFKERGEAVRSVPKPDISSTSLALNPLKALGEITRYLGDILKAIVDPSSAAQNTVKDIAVEAETKYQKDNHDILREKSKDVDASIGDKAIVDGKYQSVKPGSIDKNGNLINSPAASVSQGNEIVGAIENSKKGNIQTATVATGLSRLYNAAKKNEHGVVLSEDFLTQYLSADELKKLGLERSKKFIYVIRPKTEEEKALDNLDINRNTRTVNTIGTYLQTTGIFSPMGNVLKTIDDIKKDINPDKTIELRDASLGVNWEAGEDVFDYKKDGVPQNLYEVTPEAIQMIADKLTGKQNINIDLGNEEFVKAIENSLLNNVPEGTNLRNINRDIDVDRTYSVNRMIESNNAELQERRDNLRLKAGIENTKDMVKETKNNIHNRIFGGSSSNSNYNTYENYGWASSAANFSSGDLSGVIEASKRGVFFSDESNGKGQGSHGPSSPGENGRGYIEIKKNVYQHKCTSGPETFYYDGTNGKVDIRRPKDGSSKYLVWWDTGHPYNATDSRLDKVGFKKIFIGPLLKRTKDVQEAMKKKGLKLKPGDIMTMFGIKKGGKWSSHAQMWNGEQWVSDTYQGDLAFVYPNSRPGKDGEAIQIWRYDNSNNDNLAANMEIGGINNNSSPDPESENDVAQFNGSDMLPEVEITADSSNGHIPIHNPFQNNSNQNSSYSPYVSYSPNSNFSNYYPNAFSDNSAGGNGSFTSVSSENPNYTANLNSIGTDVKTMLDILGIMGQTDAQTLEATNNVISAVGSLRNSGTAYTPSSPSFTDGHYNQSPIS